VIFVGGLQRSGTTLTAQVIATHPLITGLSGTPSAHDEGEHLQDVYPNGYTMGLEVLHARRGPLGLPGLSRAIGDRGVTTHWAYHPSAHLTPADASRFPQARHRLLKQWRPYVENPAATILVEKSPTNVMKTRWLQEEFAESTFVIVTRHPVMQALAVMKWGTRRNRVGLGLSHIVNHWFTAMDCYRDDASELRRTMVVTFEDFLISPTSSLRVLSEHVGVDPSGFVLDTGPAREDQYLQYWRFFAGLDRSEPFSTTIPQRTPTRKLIVPIERVVATLFGPSIAHRIDREYGSRLAEYGYSMTDLTPVSGVPPR
jgi:hypothetical protein